MNIINWSYKKYYFGYFVGNYLICGLSIGFRIILLIRGQPLVQTIEPILIKLAPNITFLVRIFIYEKYFVKSTIILAETHKWMFNFLNKTVVIIIIRKQICVLNRHKCPLWLFTTQQKCSWCCQTFSSVFKTINLILGQICTKHVSVVNI